MTSLLDPIIGLRIDGRKPTELRKIQCEVGVFAQADGSATFSHGNTKVIATVYGPHEVKTPVECLSFIYNGNFRSWPKNGKLVFPKSLNIYREYNIVHGFHIRDLL